MSLIRNGVQANDDYLNMTLEYGSNKLELEVFAEFQLLTEMAIMKMNYLIPH